MNSKELLEQATAKIERMNDLMARVDTIECMLKDLGESKICFYDDAARHLHKIDWVLSPETMQRLREEAVFGVIDVRNTASAELEQLLGIQLVPEKRKPATINPEFEAATKDMFDAVHKPEQVIINPEFEKAAQEMDLKNEQPDPVEEKLSSILDKQEQEISGKSLPQPTEPGYNPKKGRQKRIYPEGMTIETVDHMYRIERMEQSEIAEHFGINKAAMGNFIFRNGITKNAEPRLPKQPEEPERP